MHVLYEETMGWLNDYHDEPHQQKFTDQFRLVKTDGRIEMGSKKATFFQIIAQIGDTFLNKSLDSTLVHFNLEFLALALNFKI